jgi:hypothetical protein
MALVDVVAFVVVWVVPTSLVGFLVLRARRRRLPDRR